MTSQQNLLRLPRLKVSERPYVWTFAVLALWALIVRLPFLHVIHDDEAFFSVVASRWLNGELPYVDSYDIKAPGIFAILAAFQGIFGVGLTVIKGVEVVFTIWGAFALYRMVRAAGAPSAAFIVAGLYLLYSLFMVGVSSPCQLVEMAFTIEAMAQVMRAETVDRRKRFIALASGGLMIGCAIMTKQTAAFTAAGLFGWLVWRSWQRREVLPLGAFCVAAAVPTIGFGLYFALCGHFNEAFDAVVTGALNRSQIDMSKSGGLGLLPRLIHFPAFFKPILVITAGAFLALLRLPRMKTVVSPTLLELVFVWYLSTVAGILVNRSPVIWYGSLMIAPTLILFSAVLCYGIDFKPKWKRAGITLYLTAACVQPLVMERSHLFISDYTGIPDYIANVRAARSLKAHGIRPGDNLLVLSRGQYVYLFTQTLPRTKYFNAMHLLCEFPTPDADPLGAAFDSQPEYILLSDTAAMISCHEPVRLAYLRSRLAMDYVQVSSVKGVWDGFGIYQLKPKR